MRRRAAEWARAGTLSHAWEYLGSGAQFPAPATNGCMRGTCRSIYVVCVCVQIYWSLPTAAGHLGRKKQFEKKVCWLPLSAQLGLSLPPLVDGGLWNNVFHGTLARRRHPHQMGRVVPGFSETRL